MQEELETVRKEVAMAEDKLATSLYTVLAQEATCAQNLGDYLHQLKVNDTVLFWVKRTTDIRPFYWRVCRIVDFYQSV